MSKQLLDAVLPSQDVEEIMAALQTIRQKMPFLLSLRPEERRRLPKLGLRAQTFVEKALDVAKYNPEIMPQPLLDIDGAKRDLALFQALNPILQNLRELSKAVECTQMLAGSEAYASARLAYRAVKAVGKGAGLDAAIEDLSQKFRLSRRQESPPEIDASQ